MFIVVYRTETDGDITYRSFDDRSGADTFVEGHGLVEDEYLIIQGSVVK